MQFSAQQGARLHRQRACFTRASPEWPHTNRIVCKTSGIGAFRECSLVGSDSLAGRPLCWASRARSQQKRWQVAAGPPSFPEPESGAYVGVKESQSGQPDGSHVSVPSNGAKPSNGAVSGLPANGVSTSASVAPEAQKGGLAHRWRIVFMMAVAFVLCNMDKVSIT